VFDNIAEDSAGNNQGLQVSWFGDVVHDVQPTVLKTMQKHNDEHQETTKKCYI